MLSTLEKIEIEEVLKNQVIGRIGCHNDGITYVVPVSYAYDGSYIYGHTFEGMKIKMMRQNPEVCFEVDIMENMANWKSVICWGHFEELTEEVDRKAALKKLLERALPIIASETVKITPLWPFSTDNLDNIKGIIYRINLTEKTGRFEHNREAVHYPQS